MYISVASVSMSSCYSIGARDNSYLRDLIDRQHILCG